MFGAGRPTDGAAERMHRAILGCGAQWFWPCAPSLPARTVYAARVLMSDPGLSPRVRGSPGVVRRDPPRVGTIPARAGMVESGPFMRPFASGFPGHAGMEHLALIERTPAVRGRVAWRKPLIDNGLRKAPENA